MEKLKQYKYIIIIVLVILGLAFYWYEWRPTQIRKWCWEQNSGGLHYGEFLKESNKFNEFKEIYTDCLRSKGLKS